MTNFVQISYGNLPEMSQRHWITQGPWLITATFKEKSDIKHCTVNIIAKSVFKYNNQD